MARILFISPFDEVCKGIRYLMAAALSAGHDAQGLILKVHADCICPHPPLKNEGYYGELFTITEEELHQVFRGVREFNPDVIGLSVFSHYTGVAEWLTDHLRREFPGLPIIWGGVDVSYNPERAIQSADMICLSDGEEPLVELLDCLGGSGDPAEIRNFWTRRDGEIIRQEVRPLAEDLDILPLPIYDPGKFKLVRGNNLAPFNPQADLDYILPYILSSRGCPSSCTYCYPSAFRQLHKGQKAFRLHSIKRIIEDIDAFLAHYPHAPFLKFADDVFGHNQQWAAQFREAYSQKHSMTFHCYIHPSVSKKPVLEELRAAGLDTAVIGIQTASERILKDVYRRPFYREGILEKFKELRELDIWPVFDLILFNPIEEEEDLKETLNLLYELPRPFGYPFLGNLMIFENFPLIHLLRKRGAKLRRLDNSNTFFSDQNLDLHRKYYGLMGLAALNDFPNDTVEKMRTADYFHDDSPMLVRLAQKLLRQEQVLVDELWIPKSWLLGRMAQEISQIRGSRAHQTVEKVRAIKRKYAGIMQRDSSYPIRHLANLPNSILHQINYNSSTDLT